MHGRCIQSHAAVHGEELLEDWSYGLKRSFANNEEASRSGRDASRAVAMAQVRVYLCGEDNLPGKAKIFLSAMMNYSSAVDLLREIMIVLVNIYCRCAMLIETVSF